MKENRHLISFSWREKGGERTQKINDGHYITLHYITLMYYVCYTYIREILCCQENFVIEILRE